MDTVDPVRVILALIFVLSLIGVLAWLAKRTGFAQMGVKQQGAGRLQVLEVRYIDPKRKLVLVKRDHVEHLLLCAEGGSTVVETGIKHNE